MTINTQVRVLLYGANIWYFGEGMLGPLFAVFTQRIGGDIFDITWAWATYLIITGSMFIVVGKLTDSKYSKRKVMVAGYALNAICTFGYVFVTTPLHLFVVQAGLGIANAMASPTWNALYSKCEDKKHDGYEWGLAGGEAQIITGIAVILGGLIVTRYSFTVLFVIMGAIQVIATLYQAKILFIKKT